MLIRRMISPTILEVEEIVFAICSPQYQERHRFFYTDISTWESLTNPTATKQDGTNFPYRRPMDQASIDWCKKYHLPRVEAA